MITNDIAQWEERYVTDYENAEDIPNMLIKVQEMRADTEYTIR